jgi:hypothetical protein
MQKKDTRHDQEFSLWNTILSLGKAMNTKKGQGYGTGFVGCIPNIARSTNEVKSIWPTLLGL